MAYPRTALEWLTKLVAFDSTSSRSNLDIVTYLHDYLASLGVPTVLVYNADKTKANLLATLTPTDTSDANKSSSGSNADGVAGDGGGGGGIILSGHLDTVPVTGQQWRTDPFTAVRVGDCVYGRGTCDMKGFIAVCMSLVPEWCAMRRSKPVYLAWTHDEEVGCLGNRALSRYIQERGLRVDGCVVGEPTSNKVVTAHKGIGVWRVNVKGKSTHSSFALTRRSCNAIDIAARLVVAIRDIAEDIRDTCVHDRYFDTPFTTMSTNTIHGGNAVNTVPESCTFTYEFRNLPSDDQARIQERVQEYVSRKLLPRMHAECADADVVIECQCSVPHLCDVDERSAFVQLMRMLTSDTQTHKLGATTEAGQYAAIGVPVVVCGPGSIGVAHQANEYVPIAELAECERLLRSLIAANQQSRPQSVSRL